MDAFMAKVKALEGSNRFVGFYIAYEAAAQNVVSQIADPELRKAEEVRMREKVREFGWAVEATPPPLTGGLWEKHGKRLKAAWEPYRKRYPNAEELCKVQIEVLEPIIRDARKIIEAEPEGDKLWFLRKKWQYLFKEEAEDSPRLPMNDYYRKRDSLPVGQRLEYYHSLPEETKRRLAAARKKEAAETHRSFDVFRKRKMELENQGPDQFYTDVYLRFETAVPEVVAQMKDSQLKDVEKERLEKKAIEFVQTIYAAPPPLMKGLWEKYKDRAQSEWQAYWKIAPDAGALRRIETGLLEPMMRDARKIIEAEAEPDKPWYLRKKWMPLLSEEAPERESPEKQP